MVPLHRFKAVIFDFDGVLVDSERLAARAWTLLGHELSAGLTPVTLGQIAGKLDRHIAPALFPGRDPVACVARKQQIERDLEDQGELSCITATIEFARRISSTHKLAVCSSSRPPRIQRILTRFNALDLFPTIVGQVDGEECKPSPAPYLKALRLLSLSAAEACAIEDSPTGLIASKSAGLFSIQLLHDGLSPSPQADVVIPSCKVL
jgi:HAD superfamily hydrolase (TIGR01509 family)